MNFNFISWLTSPYILMFVAVFTGIMFGKIKFGKFNFGISGTLFTGLVIGWGVYSFGNTITEGEKGFEYVQSMISVGVIPKEFFTIFLILFVVSVGLLAAKDMGIVLKKFGAKFVILGFAITLLGAAATYGMTFLNANSDPYEVSGVYTGALTSSPGLAAAIETAKGHATRKVETFDELSVEDKKYIFNSINREVDESDIPNVELTKENKEIFIKNAEAGIGVGHAIGYPFGVIVVIFAVNFFPKIFGIDVKKEMEIYRREMSEMQAQTSKKNIPTVNFDLLGFALACFLGYTLGQIQIYLGPLGHFSLGSTGGALLGALALGYIGKIGFINFRMDNKILSIIRQLALAFFLAIVGLRYGYKVFDSIFGSGAYLALVGLVVGLVAMLAGFFIGRWVLKINWIMLSGAICGGMTSTPGLGAAIEAVGSDEPAAGYGATYPFALLGMVIFTIVLHNLPM
ncbi:membrane protein [Clostridiisalibacter paucivorans]|uniref:aspartate-alanine antiporter-like transporter n=1 Tax=Clostridiisalibacter paucivorans TaxID=408753 RepID=UPI00047A47D9|nr:membrane protein [Clostridiisalibacter paucivorans]